MGDARTMIDQVPSSKFQVPSRELRKLMPRASCSVLRAVVDCRTPGRNREHAARNTEYRAPSPRSRFTFHVSQLTHDLA
jgi:hypothetical protein